MIGRRKIVDAAAKIGILIAYFALWAIAYAAVNRHGLHSPRTLSFPAPIQQFPWLFQPWTAVIYFLGGYLTILLPFVWNWQRRKFAFVLLSYSLVSLIAFAVYFVLPMKIPRPDYEGPGIGLRLMRAVASMDDPSNLLPSLHAALAVLCALIVSRRRPARIVRIFVWSLAAAICMSTITVGQHYFWDVPAGIVTACLGYFGAIHILKDRA